MHMNRTIAGAVAASAMVAASISPAMARGYDRGGYGGGYYGGGYGGHGGGYRHHRHHGGDGVATAIGIAALIGAVAIVASAASKNSKSRDRYGYGDTRYDRGDEDTAVNQCAEAAREEASRGGGYAEVVDIGRPQPTSDGWYVDGRVERRANARIGYGETRRFTCSVRDGRVAQVDFSRDDS
jgi:hypothetical protein